MGNVALLPLPFARSYEYGAVTTSVQGMCVGSARASDEETNRRGGVRYCERAGH